MKIATNAMSSVVGNDDNSDSGNDYVERWPSYEIKDYTIYGVQTSESQYNYIKLKPEFIVTAYKLSFRILSISVFISLVSSQKLIVHVDVDCEYNLITL